MTEPSPELWEEYHDIRYLRVSKGLPLNPVPTPPRKPRHTPTSKDIPIHPLALASADWKDVIRQPVFVAYHADRYAAGATDSLAERAADHVSHVRSNN